MPQNVALELKRYVAQYGRLFGHPIFDGPVTSPLTGLRYFPVILLMAPLFPAGFREGALREGGVMTCPNRNST
jgi:hypothetical protein